MKSVLTLQVLTRIQQKKEEEGHSKILPGQGRAPTASRYSWLLSSVLHARQAGPGLQAVLRPGTRWVADWVCLAPIFRLFLGQFQLDSFSDHPAITLAYAARQHTTPTPRTSSRQAPHYRAMPSPTTPCSPLLWIWRTRSRRSSTQAMSFCARTVSYSTSTTNTMPRRSKRGRSRERGNRRR